MSSMQHLGKGIVRAAKNYTKGYSDVQAKVRDATSNDPWGPSGTQMNELAQLSYNQDSFVEIMEMLDKRLNDKGKNWRHVFKSLTVLDYLLHAGSENVVVYFRDNLYVIKTLKEFQYIDEEGKDQGANVRQKAKDITNLLQDESRLRLERRDRAKMRDRMIKGRSGGEDDDQDFPRSRSQSLPPRRRNGNNNEDDELRKALEESKRTAAEEEARQRLTAEERDLQQAIKLSEEEEAKRLRALQDANASSLFDDAQQQVPRQTSTNPFPLVDTSFQNQSQFLQPQYTQIQPQFTSFNPYQQQAQQEAMQAEYLRQQQEWQMQQQLQAQQLQQQQLQQQQQEEWMRQQQLLQLQQQQQQQQYLMPQQQPLMPQATGFGSNNPFAPPMSLSTSSLPSQTGPQTAGPVSFNLQGTYSQQPQSSQSPPPASHSAPPGRQNTIPAVKTRADDEHSKLASLFANREDGVDTFGNYGALRYGQQAGKFVASQQTGHNPFAQQQQQQQQGGEQPFFSI
ncbi:hypothetical protein BN946_scf184998.g9 [Trametes cinnabarina]|uniref:ENTH domain-containing protein n=1 Tax=Pycnoporus cinnabarinus TaxID=5643 RepID=A0A060S2A7_PYCCI|nr:hypothetical protein BN946_scf184998.g9 [Trametes cinnabarina]